MSRVLAIASLVLISALAAAPAQAQVFGFGIGLGSEPPPAPEGEQSSEFRSQQQLCILTDHGLREAIEQQGYSKVFLNVPTGHYVQARGSRGGWTYLLTVNACTGMIADRDKLRPS
jgi:hypothetical protein